MQFRLIMPLMLKEYVVPFLGGLVASGYTVEPGLVKGQSFSIDTSRTGNVCGALLNVQLTSKRATSQEVCKHVKQVANEQQIRYYAIYVKSDNDGSGDLGNIYLPEEPMPCRP